MAVYPAGTESLGPALVEYSQAADLLFHGLVCSCTDKQNSTVVAGKLDWRSLAVVSWHSLVVID